MTPSRSSDAELRGRFTAAACEDTDGWGPEEPNPPNAINRFLDLVVDASDAVFGCDVAPYLAFGAFGVAVAFAVLIGLGLALNLPFAMLVGLLAASLTTFVCAGLVREALHRGNHVLLQDVLLVLAAAAAISWAVGLPVWRTLDVTGIAVGTFLVFGRIGCLTSGCCHGRPCSIGIRYRDAAAVGRPLVGVRLFPVQLVESAWILAITVASIGMLDRPPGTAVWCWILAYASGRFALEFARGDLERPRFGPLSEAQWTAVVLLAARIVVEEAHRPAAWRHLAVAGGASLCAIVAWRMRRSWLALSRPPVALEDVAPWQQVLECLELHAIRSASGPELHRAPGGVNVALTIHRSERASVFAYSISRALPPLARRDAFALAGLIAQRLPPHRLVRVGFGAGGVFHLWAEVEEPPGPTGSTSADPPQLVFYRALAFSRALRAAPPARSPSGELALASKTPPFTGGPA